MRCTLSLCKSVSSSVDPAEIARFASLAAAWWDPKGPMKALHALNPTRVSMIRDACAPVELSSSSVVDIGCGGGILSESLARLGAQVDAVDMNEVAIRVAQQRQSKHRSGAAAASSSNLLHYHVSSAEQLVDEGKRYDVVVASEVIEHVRDARSFVHSLAALTAKPRGVCVVTTLNRTVASLLGGVVMAEYVMGLVPPKTHDWEKFVTPEELEAMFNDEGMARSDVKGMTPYLSTNIVDINYCASFKWKD